MPVPGRNGPALASRYAGLALSRALQRAVAPRPGMRGAGDVPRKDIAMTTNEKTPEVPAAVAVQDRAAARRPLPGRSGAARPGLHARHPGRPGGRWARRQRGWLRGPRRNLRADGGARRGAHRLGADADRPGRPAERPRARLRPALGRGREAVFAGFGAPATGTRFSWCCAAGSRPAGAAACARRHDLARHRARLRRLAPRRRAADAARPR